MSITLSKAAALYLTLICLLRYLRYAISATLCLLALSLLRYVSLRYSCCAKSNTLCPLPYVHYTKAAALCLPLICLLRYLRDAISASLSLRRYLCYAMSPCATAAALSPLRYVRYAMSITL